MKAVILAGGLGTRISEETHLKPKPMIEIGGKPILWHIMKLYSAHGVNDFVVCCGYKGYIIKEYFSNYFLHMSDVTFDMANNQMRVHEQYAEPWKVTLVDTGDDTMTGGRLKRVAPYVQDATHFALPTATASPISISPGKSPFIASMANGRRSRPFSPLGATVPCRWKAPRWPVSWKSRAVMAA